MENITVYNMPENMLYQMASDKYIWKVKLNGIRKGNHESNNTRIFTEIFESKNGMLNLLASGKLMDNPFTRKDDEVCIFNYDDDTSYTYKVECPLKEAKLDVMYQLRDYIQKLYQQRNK